MRPDNRPGSLLLSREKSASIGKADLASDTTLPWLLLICLALIIAGGGYFVFDQMQKNETQRVQQNLAAIADLKANEINRWIEQNKTNAIITSNRSPVADRTQQWLDRGARPGPDLDWLRARLERLRQIHSYGEMAILSASGRPLITTEPALPDVSDLQTLIDKAIAAGEPVVGDMRWNRLRRGNPYISVPIAAPMIASGEKGGNVGVLLIHADANQFLFPLIQSWPTPSETAETFIARREDGYLLCLNELRHQKDSALKLRIPIDKPDSLAAKAFRGEKGLLRGIDYRNEPVIGYGTRIPETDWLMVAKIDQKEVYAPIRRAAITITVATLGLLLVSSLTLYLWWRQRNIINQAAQLQAEINQQFIAQQYETLSKHANDIILLMDENYRIVDANDRAEEAFGYTRAQLIGMSLVKLVLPKDKEGLDRRWKEILQSGRLMFEIIHVRSDGTVFPVEASTRVIEKGKQRFVQSVMRDISERKAAQERERRLTNIYRALAETNHAIVRLESEAELFPLICRVAAEYGDMAQAWVGIPDEKQDFVPTATYERAHDYLKEILQETTISCAPDRPEGRGPAGIAYREGRVFIANDFARDIELVTSWVKAAQRHGIRSASVFPIKRAGKSYAVFVIYSEQPNAFDEEIVHLLNEIADNVSFALDNIDRERERRQAEEELHLAALVYQESAEAMMVTDAANSIISVNPAFEKLTGYKADNVTGKNPLILSSGRDSRAHYREMLQRLAKSNYWQGELWLSKKTGEEFVAAMSISSTFHPDGSVNHHVILFADVTRRKQAEELVWQQANFDTLTGLPNRRHFLDQLKQEIRKSRRSRLPLALMFLDLDGFKDVNDKLGHEAGDLLLKETAERLSHCVRETDTVARLGGDEFIIILSEMRNTRHAEKVARHILHMLAQPFEIGKEVAHVSGSIGITFYPQDALNTDDLLFNADNAMYAAKQEGKNRYSFFTEAMQQAAQERTWLINELRGAIDGKQFRLVYQPIVELASGCIKKAEALLRWEHPERGMIDPSVFIPVAEETGMIQEIGDWVFFEAANQVAKWRQAYHPDFQISVNKSPIQFKSNADDLSAWFDHLKALNLPGQSIAVEITEGVLMDESKAVADQLLAFRDAGIEVSLDDFGTGYSALSYLKRFDIDRLKIDRTFIRDLETDPNDQALCEAMIVMGHKLGIKVIAEGVETDRQREILADAGCDFVQGYLVSDAVSAEELGNFLKKGASYCPGMPAV